MPRRLPTAVPTAVYPPMLTPMPSVWLLQTPTHATSLLAGSVAVPNAVIACVAAVPENVPSAVLWRRTGVLTATTSGRP